jgi:hypothetical protein
MKTGQTTGAYSAAFLVQQVVSETNLELLI